MADFSIFHWLMFFGVIALAVARIWKAQNFSRPCRYRRLALRCLQFPQYF